MQAAAEEKQSNILVVDDEVAMVRSLEMLLRPIGQVKKAYSIIEAEDYLKSSVDCIVTDVCMPEGTGLELLEKVRRKRPEIPVIVMTAYSSIPQAVDAMQRGAFEYVVKPFENEDLVDTVKRALRSRGQILGGTAKIPEGWVCNSPRMKNFLAKSDALAKNPLPVMIVGERGTGKKRAARWMFEQRKRRGKELLVVDARSHEEDSSLFKADNKKIDSILVAEIFAGKRSLQDRLFEIVESGKTKVFVSCTGSPEFQKPKDFHSDLYERLSQHVVEIPSLADRPEDFSALCNRLLEGVSKLLKRDLSLDTAAQSKLQAHSYMGNVKELEAVLERAAVAAVSDQISEKDISFDVYDFGSQLPFAIPVEGGWERLNYLQRSLEKDLILRTMEKYPESSNSEIATVLGTTRRILELRMKSYQIRES